MEFFKEVINLLFIEQCSIVPSAANRDLGTTENSFLPIYSFRFILGLDLQTTSIRANKLLSSLSSTICSTDVTLTDFPELFQVFNHCFFIGHHRLVLPVLMRSPTNASNSIFPISLCLQRSCLTSSGMTTFVKRLNRSLLSSANGEAFEC